MRGDSELTIEGLAHDLNNVFATLAEASELLSSDPKWTKLATAIRRSVRRGERIVASIGETISGTGDLLEILDNAALHTEDVLTFTRGGAVQYDRRLQPGVCLPGSPAKWERVFVNLFLNAAQASPQGAIVEIDAALFGGVITLTVADSGPGIPASILPTIFDPDVSTKKSRGRGGIGLHIVHSIVSEHAGTVTAENREPSGAIFTLSVPQSGVA